jgi:hypothetical protein
MTTLCSMMSDPSHVFTALWCYEPLTDSKFFSSNESHELLMLLIFGAVSLGCPADTVIYDIFKLSCLPPRMYMIIVDREM